MNGRKKRRRGLSAETLVVSGSISIFVLLGLLLFGLGVGEIVAAVRSTSWPKTVGRVLERPDSTYRPARPVIAYRVAGAEYGTDSIVVGQTGTSNSAEEELLHLRYPAGSEVDVYYDPAKPWVGVLQPGWNLSLLALPGAGLGFGVPGLMFLFLYLGSEQGSGMMGAGLKLFAGIFLAVGGLLVGMGLTNLWNGYRSRSWPRAEGEIVYARQESAGRRSQATNLVFRYEVDGQPHYSNQRRFGQLAGAGSEWAEAISAKYPQGSRLPVYYRPGDPDTGVLEPGIGEESWWLPGAGAAMVLFGLAVWFFAVPALTRT